MRRTILSLVLSLAIFGPCGAQAKDLVIRQRVSSGAPAAAAYEEMQYWSGKKRVTDTPQNRTIIDFDAQTFTVANKDNKTYVVRTFDEMRTHMEGMKKSRENLPSRAKDAMGDSTTPVSLRPTGKTE